MVLHKGVAVAVCHRSADQQQDLIADAGAFECFVRRCGLPGQACHWPCTSFDCATHNFRTYNFLGWPGAPSALAADANHGHSLIINRTTNSVCRRQVLLSPLLLFLMPAVVVVHNSPTRTNPLTLACMRTSLIHRQGF